MHAFSAGKYIRMNSMQGTVFKQKKGYKYLRVGRADNKFLAAMIPIPIIVILYLAILIYREIPASNWRLAYFLIIYTVAALLYLNLGVWLHEQLHCLPFRNSLYAERMHIVYERKNLLVLSGYYRVSGAIDYRTMRRALSSPILLPVGLLVIAWLGSLVLTRWWFAIMASLAMAAVLDMTHDIFMLMQIRSIGNKGKYWDKGHYLEVVWK